jgi:cation diffusion facilitator CzcD-associated flavoprotein CzcO
MQPDMQLRAIWDHMTLTAPGGRGTLSEWMAETGSKKKEPMTPPDFISYAEWYRERYVPYHDAAEVVSIADDGRRFRVTSTEGDWSTQAIVIAVGITPFPLRPQFADVADPRIAPASDRDLFKSLHGATVIVVGGGQSAVEAAAYATRAGARVTLVTRGKLHWFVNRKPKSGDRFRWWLYRLAYPEQGIGPPGLNRFASHPDLYATFPPALRDRITARIMRSGASPWLQQMVKGKIEIREGVEVSSVESRQDRLAVRLSDGAVLAADRLLLGTGYRFSVDQLSFLEASIRSRIAVRKNWPVLDRSFRSSDPRIAFIGYPAEGTFGPFCRFVRGASFSAARAVGGLRGALR